MGGFFERGVQESRGHSPAVRWLGSNSEFQRNGNAKRMSDNEGHHPLVKFLLSYIDGSVFAYPPVTGTREVHEDRDPGI